mgnify:CR=1 FL=1
MQPTADTSASASPARRAGLRLGVASWIAGIAQEKARPNGAALRVLPPLLYGEGHPYAIPFSGTGNEASIASLTRDDLMAYHDRWVRPDTATLLVVGDTTLKEIVPVLEKYFGTWKGEGESRSTRIARNERADAAAAPRPAWRGRAGASGVDLYA